MSDPETVTEAELAEALDGFWLFADCGDQRVHGQVADPGEVAAVLLATLGRIAAGRSPDEQDLPVAGDLDRPTIDSEAPTSDDTGRVLAGSPEKPRERPWVSEDFRIRLARAMYESLDRCPRCKVCEHQIGAAAKVMAKAVSAEREQAGAGRVRVLRYRLRAEAAEGKLAALRAHCREAAYGNTNMWEVMVSAGNILAITGTEKKGDERNG